MFIKDIKESGSNNILMWAIRNNANIQGDEQLQSVINDELFYQVTFGDVNFFELFRLTQLYREKLRVVDESPADIPPTKELVSMFNGSHTDDNGNNVPLHELVEFAIQKFMDLTAQMGVDDDIINPGARQLFIPMICRKFDVQIPIGFMDIAYAMSSDEFHEVFNSAYPNTIHTILDNDNHSVKTNLLMAFIRSTSPIRYNEKYEKYVNATKYFALNAHPTENIYHYALLGFHKYNPVSRGELRVNMFMPDMSVLENTMKRINRVQSPLEIDFVVRVPIQYMQMIQNNIDPAILKINYESSIQSILSEGIQYNDFTLPNIDPETDDPEQIAQLDDFNNRVSAYRVRIAEANQAILNAINILLKANADIDPRCAIALLPSIYPTKAVFTVHADKRSKYLDHQDPMVADIFIKLFNMGQNLMNGIANSR